MSTDAIIVAAIVRAGISVVTACIAAGHCAGQINTRSFYASFPLTTASSAHAI